MYMHSALKGKTILITSGGTQEYIDQVRYMTNVSTGKLGARLAELACEWGANVRLVRTKGSTEPRKWSWSKGSLKSYEATDVKSAMRHIKRICKRSNPDAVIMTMAGADWGFKKTADKLSSDSKEAFMAFLEENMIRNPKIIEHILEWAPNTFLVGFKFMVNFGHDNLIQLARDKARKWGAGLVVANDKAEMQAENAHVAHFVRPRRKVQTVRGKKLISQEILKIIQKL